MWLFFIVFSLINVFLSYSNLSLILKGLLFFMEISLFLFISIGKGWTPLPDKKLSQQDLISNPPLWLWLIGVIGFTGIRFFKLITLRLWPSGDESLQGFLGIFLSQHWKWQFFYTVGQHPPLSIWLYSFLCRVSDSAFLNFWGTSALVSCLLVVVGYLAARQYFSVSFSFIFGSLLAFSYWPVYSGRFYIQFVPFFELVDFALVGLWINSKKPNQRKWYSVAIGAWTGLGLFTYTSWLAVGALVLVIFVFLCFQKNDDRIRNLFCFFFPLILTSVPFCWGVFNENYGAHWGDILFSNRHFSSGRRERVFLSYFTSLFWGSLESDASYGPNWGGFLNPVLTTFFFFGLVRLFCLKNRFGFGLFLIGFLWLMMPGLVTSDYPCLFRIIQVMPPLLLVVAFGIQTLMTTFGKTGKSVFLVGLLTVSSGLDFYHLLKPVLVISRLFKVGFQDQVEDQNFPAYKILKEKSDQSGPGFIFGDFLLLSHDHSLTVTTYGFNGSINPKINPQDCHWAAVIANIHYQPFLIRRFPVSQWYWIGRETADEDGGLCVGIIPIETRNREVFNHWNVVHAYFHALNFEAENILNDKVLYRKATEKLSYGYSLMAGDHFLEACFGEWVAQYHFGSDFGPNIQAIHRAIEKGYPTANLYYKLGNFYLINHQAKEAHHAYLMAAKSNPNYTNVKDVLSYLGSKH